MHQGLPCVELKPALGPTSAVAVHAALPQDRLDIVGKTHSTVGGFWQLLNLLRSQLGLNSRVQTGHQQPNQGKTKEIHTLDLTLAYLVSKQSFLPESPIPWLNQPENLLAWIVSET